MLTVKLGELRTTLEKSGQGYFVTLSITDKMPIIYLTHSVQDAHLCARSPPPPFDEMRIYAHGNRHGCTLRCALECIFLLVNLNENGWTIG